MNQRARLASARDWLATQRRRTPDRLAKSYRKHYGVDWLCALRELESLGVRFPPHWVAQLKRSLKGNRHLRAARKAARNVAGESETKDSDDPFAFIAGYTSNGAPFGVTWEEWKD